MLKGAVNQPVALPLSLPSLWFWGTSSLCVNLGRMCSFKPLRQEKPVTRNLLHLLPTWNCRLKLVCTFSLGFHFSESHQVINEGKLTVAADGGAAVRSDQVPTSFIFEGWKRNRRAKQAPDSPSACQT